MKKASFSLALLAAVGLFLTIAVVRSIAAQQHPANAPVPLERLSAEQRAKTLPDSTLVQFRNKTITLGQLRATHQARIMSLANAHANGVLAARNLHSQKPTLVSAKAGSPGRVHVNEAQAPSYQRRIGANNGAIPAAAYGSVPADMRAFCAAAGATACLYLPPQQFMFVYMGSVMDADDLISQSQCMSEGGSWTNGSGQWYCSFLYPQSVTVTFTPASNFQLSSTAQCDQSLFTYQVDTHGAVGISIKQTGEFTTGSSSWCVVNVTPGGN